MMNYGLLLAAGSGRRFGGGIPKQFQELAGEPVINYSARVFEDCERIDGYGILVPAGREEETWRLLPRGIEKCIFIVAGGQSRRDTVRRGLQQLEEQKPKNVLVHDGARPVIEAGLLKNLLTTLEQDETAGGVIPVCPLRDTVKRVAGENPGRVLETLPRGELRRVQTPQVFEFSKLLAVHQNWPADRKVTDDAMMLEEEGEEILTVEGTEENIKMTYPRDKKLMRSYL